MNFSEEQGAEYRVNKLSALPNQEELIVTVDLPERRGHFMAALRIELGVCKEPLYLT